MVGCRVDLAPGHEHMTLDVGDGTPIAWIGGGVAPLAVPAIFRLHGPEALLVHAGLAPLRYLDQESASSPASALESPVVCASW